tara:strand:- start:139 stop:360 length:222 start_codon:yes stop_codon:yes gene_type:complete
MKNIHLDNTDDYIEINTPTKLKHIQQNFKSKTVDINKLLNRVKINERNKKKENLLYLGIATIVVSFVAFFSII